MDGETTLSDFFGESDAHNFPTAASPDDIFSVLEALESASDCNQVGLDQRIGDGGEDESFEFPVSAYNSPLSVFLESETEAAPSAAAAAAPKLKRQKLNGAGAVAAAQVEEGGGGGGGGWPQRVSHINVERNRRKQMNEHLSVLRSLMPCFYVKGGDQASIIGGVVDYINELQQVLQSLQAKKQRKSYADVLSPRPPPPPPSPLKPPLSPRLSLPVSPTTPQSSTSPYKAILHNQQMFFLNSPLPSPRAADRSPCNSSTSSIIDSVNELVASSKSAVAEVEVKFSGSNLVLNTASHRIPGQAVRIISALEELPLEILGVNVSTVDETLLNSFTIKIGVECHLSAEELAHQIQLTFC